MSPQPQRVIKKHIGLSAIDIYCRNILPSSNIVIFIKMFHALILTIVSNCSDFIDSLWVFAAFLSDIDGNELGKSQIIINKCVFHENSDT